ncbi:MAG: hypothetical protein KC502_05375 [Myxococcales bacterium]|nr:hypothetical protein [Myxococcales bacterium]
MDSKKWPIVLFALVVGGVFFALSTTEPAGTAGIASGQGGATGKQATTVATNGATTPAALAQPKPPSPRIAALTKSAPNGGNTGGAGNTSGTATNTALPAPPQPTTANPPGEPKAAAGEVALFFSANNKGELIDCGCRKSPLGGLARRAKWVDERKTRFAGAVHVDAGGSLSADAGLDADGPGQAAGRTEVYLAGLAAAHTAALNVAPAELAVGKSVLVSAAKRHKVDLVATNTVAMQSGKPAFKPWLIIGLGDLKVAILGLTTQRPPRHEALYTKQGLALTTPMKAAQRAVTKLKGKVDAIVALSWLSQAEMDDLGEKVPEIDFIIGAKDSDLTMRPEFLGRGFRMDSYDKGKWLGELRLRKGKTAERRWFNPDLRDRLAYDQGSAQREVAYYLKKHADEDKAGGPKDPRSRKFERDRLVAQRAKLARVNLELKGDIDPPDGAPSFSLKMHAMRTSLPENPAITKLVDGHHKRFPPPPRH